jgi:glycosyltransferase involved in cell wall biosynthesis
MTVEETEIPYPFDRKLGYRLLEILPGALTWSVLILPFVLSFVSPFALAIIIIAYMIAWFLRAMGQSTRVVQSYATMRRHQALDWAPLIADLDDPKASLWRLDRVSEDLPGWHQKNLNMRALQIEKDNLRSKDIYHAVIIPTYNEPKEVLELTVKHILKTKYDLKKIILILAPEERDGGKVVEASAQLVKKYGSKFYFMRSISHPPKYEVGEIKGKGANESYAAVWLAGMLKRKKIAYQNVVVTVLDSDHHPDPNYFSELSYVYLMSPDRKHTSYQPISLLTSNIWDAPAPMRILALGTSFWMMIVSMRPHMLRNFAAHGQGMDALVECNYWSKRTIVEDGHQFWRSYFRFDGKHEVFPIFSPIYQDAVLAETYKKTFRAQFLQLRRWAWGASDIPYVIQKGFFTKNSVPKLDLFFKTVRLIEGHLSWATASLIVAFSASIPVYINPNGRESFVANQLPVIASYIQTVSLIGIIITLYLSMKLLPKKPARYRRTRHISMVIQWIFMPIATILFGSTAALVSQTRLMFGRYIGNFDVTTKTIKK